MCLCQSICEICRFPHTPPRKFRHIAPQPLYTHIKPITCSYPATLTAEMNRNTPHLRSSSYTTLTNENHHHHHHKKHKHNGFSNGVKDEDKDFSDKMKKRLSSSLSSSLSSGNANNGLFCNAYFMTWRPGDLLSVVRNHPIPCVFAACMLLFMGVEYTLRMVPSSSQPFDLGFVATKHLHGLLASRPTLNNILAGLNTVFVGLQMIYILWTWLIEGRVRATISTLFMFTFRGILGYSTQLPLPEGFLGSGVDFPVGNVSFFLFYSGHVAASVIASLDMRRMRRWELAYIFDVLNVLQVVRLLSTRGHYTIDLAVGVGAGMLFDSFAGKYEESKRRESLIATSTTYGAFDTYRK